MKKALILVMAALLALSLLAGCTQSGGTPTPAATTASAATTAAATASAAPVVADAPRELTIAAARFAQHVDWDQMYVWQEFEKQTGIKVNWVYIDGVALEEKRNLMVSTGELYDAFYGCKWKPGELASYIDDGIFVPIQDYMEQYAPNTTKLYNEMPDIKSAMIMPDGNIYGFPLVYSTKRVGTSMFLRTEWMEKLNLEKPKTVEDLYNILVAFKTQDPNGNGLDDELVYTDYIDQLAYSGLTGTLMGAYGLGNRGSDENFDIDPDTQQLRYFKTDPKFKELLTLLNRLYAAGCIDPDALTQEEVQWGAKASQNDPAIVGCVTNDVLDAYNADEYYEGTGILEGPYGDTAWASVRRQVARTANYVITKECQNIPLAMEFADFWMDNGPNTEMFFYGQEGVHFYWDGDRRARTDMIAKDPQGRSADQMISTFTSQPGGMYFGIIQANKPDPTKNGPKADAMVEPYLPEIVWPVENLTSDEMKVMSSVGEDIKTYLEESIVGFVRGTMSLENDWDTYVKSINDMGLDQVIAVKKAWYDRYKANGGR